MVNKILCPVFPRRQVRRGKAHPGHVEAWLVFLEEVQLLEEALSVLQDLPAQEQALLCDGHCGSVAQPRLHSTHRRHQAARLLLHERCARDVGDTDVHSSRSRLLLRHHPSAMASSALQARLRGLKNNVNGGLLGDAVPTEGHTGLEMPSAVEEPYPAPLMPAAKQLRKLRPVTSQISLHAEAVPGQIPDEDLLPLHREVQIC
mmetsp:Transcript_71761/g.203624  ORF Transcript_71761/g.203624 Transcript_71761/m.203624 type:complete len:203 (-) Transcript_71761:82-690(-)